MKNYRKRMAAMCMTATLILTGCNAAGTDSTKDAVEVTEGTESSSVDIAALDVVSFTGDYSDRAKNAEWSKDSSVAITLKDSSAQASGEGVTITGSDIVIENGGTYVLTGKLTDGTITIEAPEDQNVQLVLNGADITCKDYAPVVVKSAKNVFLTLAENTSNTITDGETCEYAADDTIQPTAAIFSKTDLVINGAGSLTVNGNYKDGITSKDDLEVISGTINITSADDGIVGKDSVSVMSGEITIVSEGDGIKTTNIEDTAKGFIVIDGGIFNIASENDGIQAVTQLIINDGTFEIVTNEGSTNASTDSSGKVNEEWKKSDGNFNRQEMPADGERPELPENGTSGGNAVPPQDAAKDQSSAENTASEMSLNVTAASTDSSTADSTQTESSTQTEESTSAKALKAGTAVGIFGGTFTIDSSDDAVHSNGAVRVAAGKVTISSGDDGLHSDTDMLLEGGSILISKSYEGIESKNVTVNGGDIQVTASDDGINVAGGNDSSSMNGRPGQNTFSSTGDSTGKLTITDGNLTVSSNGDGLDSNGAISMSGGNVTVYGPTNSGNGALDYDSTFDLTGGELYIAGSSGMAQVPSNSSTQPFVAAAFDSSITGGTEVVVTDSKGTVVAKWTPAKDYSMVCVANGEIAASETYTITAGDVTTTTEGGTTSSIGAGGGHGGGMNRPARQ